MKRIIAAAVTAACVSLPVAALAQTTTPAKKPDGPGQSENAPGQKAKTNPKKDAKDYAPGQIQKNTDQTAKENAPGQQDKTNTDTKTTKKKTN